MLTVFLLCPACPVFADEGSLFPDAILDPGRRPGHILVTDKANQILYLYSHDGKGRLTLEKVMPCSTGGNKGDKMVEGDKKTPNGFYIFKQKLLPRELSPIYGTLAYPTDYPNYWDKKLGRGGYGIWLHGINKPLVDYDSNGCVELENVDVAKMEDLIHLYDTPLITYEELVQASEDDLRREAGEVHDFIESWRAAWINKRHADYRAKYAPDFVNSDGRSFEGWMTHKENVAKKYKRITVDLKDLRIYRHRDVVVVLFEQDYRGDENFTSIGLKRLYLKRQSDGYKIVAEEFRPKPQVNTNKRLTAEEKRKAIETPPLTVAKKVLPPSLPQASEESRLQSEMSDEEQNMLTVFFNPEDDDSLNLAEEEAQARAAAQARAEARAREQAELEAAQAREQAERDAEQARAEALAREQAELNKPFIDLVESWAGTWRKRDIPAFFEFYHPDFYYQDRKMNRAEFVQYRSRLINNTSAVRLEISDFQVEREGDTVKVSFVQNYRADNIKDYGRKTLTFKESGDGWKIVAETWKALKRQK